MNVKLEPGGRGDFKVSVSGKVILDKASEPSDFTTLNAAADLCPEGKPKPFPKATAAAKVSIAIDAAVAGVKKSDSCEPGPSSASAATYIAGGIIIAVAATLLHFRR